MDPPTVEPSAKDGLISVAISPSRARRRSIDGCGRNDRPAKRRRLSRLRAEFTRQNGQLTIREGVVKGLTIGGTIEGSIDSARPGADERHFYSAVWAEQYGWADSGFGAVPGRRQQ